MLQTGNTITVHNREATVIKRAGGVVSVEYDNGGIGYDYVARHELPDECRTCGDRATHRVEVNAPGNGDCYAACADCARDAAGHYVSIEEVRE